MILANLDQNMRFKKGGSCFKAWSNKYSPIEFLDASYPAHSLKDRFLQYKVIVVFTSLKNAK